MKRMLYSKCIVLINMHNELCNKTFSINIKVFLNNKTIKKTKVYFGKTILILKIYKKKDSFNIGNH